MTPPADPIGRLIDRAARGFALFGGVLLTAIAAISVVSILGRWLLGKPIQGDFELVQIACAGCVTCFLPWCQMRRGHVLVDFFTNRLPPRTRLWFDAAGTLAIAAVAGLVAWRTGAGLLAVKAAGETSMILGMPIWWGYVPMAPAFALLALAACHGAAMDAIGATRR